MASLLGRIGALASGTHALALADQAVVSGTSFLTMILIGRWAGSRELGLYAIGMSVLAAGLSVQDSLISLPYTILKHRLSGTPQERAGNALAHNLLLSIFSLGAIGAVAIGLALHGAGGDAVALMSALAAATPFILLREFGRRFAFAHLEMARVFALDLAVATLQLGLLGLFQWRGLMSAPSALLAIGAACGSVGLIWIVSAKSGFTIRANAAQRAMGESWRLGKWLFASAAAVNIQWYASYWISSTVLGVAQAGVFAACISVVSFANPLITGLNNILTPRAVLTLKNKGPLGLRRQAIWDAVFIGAAVGAFCIVIFVAGDRLMQVLYSGAEYRGQGATLSALALALLAQAVGTSASSGLASMERPRAILIAGSIAAIVTVFSVAALMLEDGLFGAACGFLLGNIVGAAGRWIGFLSRVQSNAGDSTRALQVIEQFAQQPAGAECIVTQIGEGDHASVVSVRAKGGAPILPAQDALVLKFYRPEAKFSVEMLRDQYMTVARLHAALNDYAVEGWRICAPKPLFLCFTPPTLVMTRAPGKNLYTLTAKNDGLRPDALRIAAYVIVRALSENWRRGQAHGDLALQNILYDFDSKTISFIDGGTPENCGTCHANRGRWAPAVLDVAHLISDVVTDMKRTIINQGARARRTAFVEYVLQSLLRDVETRQSKLTLIEEIDDCTRVHLEDLLLNAPSPRGLWRWIVKRAAVRRLDGLIVTLRAGLPEDEGQAGRVPLQYKSRSGA